MNKKTNPASISAIKSAAFLKGAANSNQPAIGSASGERAERVGSTVEIVHSGGGQVCIGTCDSRGAASTSPFRVKNEQAFRAFLSEVGPHITCSAFIGDDDGHAYFSIYMPGGLPAATGEVGEDGEGLPLLSPDSRLKARSAFLAELGSHVVDDTMFFVTYTSAMIPVTVGVPPFLEIGVIGVVVLEDEVVLLVSPPDQLERGAFESGIDQLRKARPDLVIPSKHTLGTNLDAASKAQHFHIIRHVSQPEE